MPNPDTSLPCYAQLTDIPTYGVTAAALSSFDNPTQTAALRAASREIDGYLQSQFQLPLVQWNEDIIRACVIIAVWNLLSNRGYNPELGSTNDEIDRRYKVVLAWLDAVGKGEISPVLTDSTPGPVGGPFVLTPTYVTASSLDPRDPSDVPLSAPVPGAPTPRGW